MSISLNVGKARIFPISAAMSDGSQNTTLAASAATNTPSKLKVMINPSNNRELGVLALVGGSAGDVTVTVGTLQSAATQVQPIAPTLVSVSLGADAGEVDPPAWLTA